MVILGDFYTIDVAEEENSLKVLLVCLTIDACLQSNSNAQLMLTINQKENYYV